MPRIAATGAPGRKPREAVSRGSLSPLLGFRLNFRLFLALAGTGKAARHAAVVLAAQGVFG